MQTKECTERNNFPEMRLDFVFGVPSDDTGLSKMSLYLSQAIVMEVCAHPKPGMVTRCSNGSHKDMSILTFAASSAVLSMTFRDLQEMGRSFFGTPEELLTVVRIRGIEAERELLHVTKGVNTQRGILFSGGLLSAAAGYVQSRGFGKKALLTTVKQMTSGLVQKELSVDKEGPLTAGEQLFKTYGITGIRGEVEKGFPSVTDKGLPALEEAFSNGAELNDALVHSLISLMTVVEDSNVIWRTDIQTAEEVKRTAADILSKGSVFTAAGKNAIRDAEKCFVSRRISPGGSADLLSVVIAMYLLEHGEFPVQVM